MMAVLVSGCSTIPNAVEKYGNQMDKIVNSGGMLDKHSCPGDNNKYILPCVINNKQERE